MDVSSGVSAQPMSDAETRPGAANRVVAALIPALNPESYPHAENGPAREGERMDARA